jgi:hypothetical protein|tara:strand:+ start:133 stop:471 length:339 start_codon:yes stop_codon:yes gene_type:complete
MGACKLIPPIKTATSSPPSLPLKKIASAKTIGISAGGGIIVVMLLRALFIHHRKKSKRFKEDGPITEEEVVPSSSFSRLVLLSLRSLSLDKNKEKRNFTPTGGQRKSKKISV